MKNSTMLHYTMAMLSLVLFLGCAYVPPSQDKTQWYATLDKVHWNSADGKPASDKICLQINSPYWEPLLGPDGFGGKREMPLYFSYLEGIGPEYRDPEFGTASSPSLKSRHLGTIMVDKQNKRVIIDLQRVVSKPGEPQRTEPSPANGTYPLKRWIE
jgi:hypothetical protein